MVALALAGLDWASLQAPLDRGELPRLAQLIEQGTWAPIAVARADVPVSIWTTFATGEIPPVHGVLQPIERLAGTLFVRAVAAASVRVPGLASIAARAGRRVASIGWPATDGLVLEGGWAIGPGADLPPGAQDAHAPLDPRTALPDAAAQAVRAFRMHPRELAGADLDFFLAPLPPAARQRVEPAFAQALARTSARHACATHALETLPGDVVLVHLPLIAEVAPLLAELGDAGAEVHARCLRFVDLLLGPYLARGETPTRVLVVSDSAFAIAAGPGVARDRMADPLPPTGVFDLMAALAEVTPAGRPAPPEALAFIDWQPRVDPAARAPTSPPALSAADYPDDFAAHPTAADLHRLALAPPVDWTPWREAARGVRRDMLLALARSLSETGGQAQARDILQALLDESPGFLPARIAAARLAWKDGRLEDFAALAAAGRRLHGEGALGDAARLLECLAARDWPAFDAALAAATAVPSRLLNLHTVAGRARQLRGDAAGAGACFEAAVAREPDDAHAWAGLAEALTRLGRHDDAVRACGRAVSLQPGRRAPLMALSAAQGRAGDWAGAMQTLLRASLARA